MANPKQIAQHIVKQIAPTLKTGLTPEVLKLMSSNPTISNMVLEQLGNMLQTMSGEADSVRRESVARKEYTMLEGHLYLSRALARRIQPNKKVALARDVGVALVRDVMTNEMKGSTTKSKLLSWFQGGAWGRIFDQKSFAEAVRHCIREGFVEAAGRQLTWTSRAAREWDKMEEAEWIRARKLKDRRAQAAHASVDKYVATAMGPMPKALVVNVLRQAGHTSAALKLIKGYDVETAIADLWEDLMKPAPSVVQAADKACGKQCVIKGLLEAGKIDQANYVAYNDFDPEMESWIQASHRVMAFKEDMAPQVILLMGLPAAGKSTFVKKHLSRYFNHRIPHVGGFQVINSDGQLLRMQFERAKKDYEELKKIPDQTGYDAYTKDMEYTSNDGAKVKFPLKFDQFKKVGGDFKGFYKATYKPYYASYFGERAKAKQVTDELAEKKLKSGDVVILDSTGAASSKYLKYFEAAKQRGYTTSVVWLDIDVKYSIARDEYRGETEGRSVGADVIKAYVPKIKAAYGVYRGNKELVDRFLHFKWKGTVIKGEYNLVEDVKNYPRGLNK